LSVLKSKATNSPLKSEKKSLFRFLALYIAFILLMIVILSLYYYENQEKLMLSQQSNRLSHFAFIQTKRLKVMHQKFKDRITYPRDSRFKSAIYDLEYMKIFSLLECEKDIFEEGISRNGSYFHFVYRLDDYYLGAKYLVIEVNDEGRWEERVWKSILFYGSVAFLLFLLFGLYFMRLFLKPMRDSILLLDHFIKDTTHELNTPLSAILGNVEMMDTEVMAPKNLIRLNRINIAAKSLSILYQDLTYLTLEQESAHQIEEVDIAGLMENRVEYFKTLANSKGLSFALEVEPVRLWVDRRKFTRVLDNLLSNAIKYNRRNGYIKLSLTEDQLRVEDSGIGIEKEHLAQVFDRYRRFNSVEGGFGVGLSIVKSIVDEYRFDIEIDSTKGVGTKVILRW
jgi:two-component system OmpR family sensor kinase